MMLVMRRVNLISSMYLASEVVHRLHPGNQGRSWPYGMRGVMVRHFGSEDADQSERFLKGKVKFTVEEGG